MMSNNNKKKGLGRHKIEIKKINKQESRQVTFSKRRRGLFNKASELSIICGAEIAIITFSPAGKAYSFGNPSVESTVNQFLLESSGIDNRLVEYNGNESSTWRKDVEIMKIQYNEVLKQVEVEKKRKERLEELKTSNGNDGFWWEAPIDDLSVNELEQLRRSIVDLEKNVTKRIDELLIMKSTSLDQDESPFVMDTAADHESPLVMDQAADHESPFVVDQAADHESPFVMDNCYSPDIMDRCLANMEDYSMIPCGGFDYGFGSDFYLI